MQFHSILIRKLPSGTEKAQIYFIDQNDIVQRSQWKFGRNIEYYLPGIIFPNLVIGIDYYLDGRLMHVKRNFENILFVGPKVPNIPLSPITVLFQTHKGYFMESNDPIKSNQFELFTKTAKTNPDTCQRISILELQISKLHTFQNKFNILSMKDHNLKERIEYMKSVCEKKRSQVDLMKRKINSFQHFIATKQGHLNRQLILLSEEKSRLSESIIIYSQNKQNLLSIISNCQQMQMNLIRDLSFVYHIDMNSGKCYINGCHLPNSIFVNVDFKEVIIALGFCAHLVSLLQSYLFINLRYPILCRGSHSILLDPITQYPDGQSSPSGRIIKLWNAADTRLDWAVYLLNKDIEQIMFLRGQKVRDLRKTLPNLKLILDLVQERSWTESETQTTMSDNFDYLLSYL